jgi:hypothetical protein
MFKPLNTSDHTTSYRKVLLYAHHGWGKTTQAAHYKRYFGKGFIISGESGLSSIRSEGIDYLPFTSFDGEHDPDKGVYSFNGICEMIDSPEFKAAGYKWIMLDSLTELSDMIHAEVEAAHANDEKKNNFVIWGEYASMMIGSCKWVRDLPYHVIVTCLAKEESNDNAETEYWPMVKGSQVQKQLPGIFDCVLCGVRHTTVEPSTGQTRVERLIVTDEHRGWHGKVRDEKRRLRPVERQYNACELFRRMDMSDEEYAAFVEEQRAARAQQAKPESNIPSINK